MNHDEVRESISARLDGEQAALSEAAVDNHLRVCADCRAWAAEVAAGVPAIAAGAEPPPTLTADVLRAVSADLGAAGSLHRQRRWLRAGLVAVGVVQLVLAVPVLVLGHDHSAPLHVAHELGSFDAAVAVGLLLAARRPRLASGMVALVGVITALLMITAGSDLAAGRTDVLDEAPHLLDLVAFVLLRRLAVVSLGGPSGPPGLLVPLSTGPRPSAGGLAALTTARRAVGRALPPVVLCLRWAGRRLVVVGGVAAATVIGVAGPASAHVVHEGDDPTNWRSTVVAVSPAVPGVTVAIAEGGQRIGVTNRSGRSVVVLGFSGEPYLRLRAGVVEANTRSATAQQIVSGLPGTADPSNVAVPDWHPIGHATTWWWHDPRTHFTGYELPPPVLSNESRFVHYQDWRIGLVVDGRPSTVLGSLDWVPPRTALAPWLLGLGALAACAGIGWLRRWSRPLVVALVAVTAVDVWHAFSAAAGRVGSVTNHLAALPGHGVLIAAVWLLAGLGCFLAWRRRPAAAYVGLIAAGVMVMVDALPSAGVLWHSQAVTTLSHPAASAVVAAVLGAGTGTSIACFVLMLRLDPVPKNAWLAPPEEQVAEVPVTNG